MTIFRSICLFQSIQLCTYYPPAELPTYLHTYISIYLPNCQLTHQPSFLSTSSPAKLPTYSSPDQQSNLTTNIPNSRSIDLLTYQSNTIPTYSLPGPTYLFFARLSNLPNYLPTSFTTYFPNPIYLRTYQPISCEPIHQLILPKSTLQPT